MTDKFTCLIPKESKHGEAIHCPVEPPHDKMTIEFFNPDEKTPFATGYVAGRRCPEIAGYVFRPMKLNLESRQRDQHLKKGDKVVVSVKFWNKVEQPKTKMDKPKMSELIQEVKETLTIT